MDADAFQRLAEATFASLPERFVRALENVVIVTEAYPDAETLARMKAQSALDLLGLYRGCPLPERGSTYAGQVPDMIHLYRQPILAWCRRHGEDVGHCIRHVLIHEIGHYFGFSDAEMEAIEEIT
jgi:Uncharacterized protein conserved in bacteria